MSLLLSSGSRLQSSCLHNAVRMSGYITGQEIAFLLLHYGADTNTRDDHGQCPLSLAVWVNNTELCEELIRLGSHPGQVSSQLLDTASHDIKHLIAQTRANPAPLQLLTKRCIRDSVLKSNCDIPFPVKLSKLQLPQKLINTIL